MISAPFWSLVNAGSFMGSPGSDQIGAGPLKHAALPHDPVAKPVSNFEDHGLEKEILARRFGGCA
jgi:hypothetical protein